MNEIKEYNDLSINKYGTIEWIFRFLFKQR